MYKIYYQIILRNDGIYCTLIALIDKKNISKGVRVVKEGYSKEMLITKLNDACIFGDIEEI